MKYGLVIGASSAIGAAICARLAADVELVGVSIEDTQVTGCTQHLVGDASQIGIARHAVAAASPIGRLDLLVLAAGISIPGPLANTPDSAWESMHDASLRSAFTVLREAIPVLSAGAAVVAIGSVNAMVGHPGMAAYAAAKGGLEALMRQCAVELGPLGVRFNTIAPGLIGEAQSADAAAGYPIGRIGTPADVAAAVAFLASPEAGFITGVTLPVDGGLSVASPAAYLRADLRARFPRGGDGDLP